MKKHLGFALGLTVMWAFIVGLIVLQAAPDLPRTRLGWFLLIVAGPPTYVLGEAVFGWVFSPEHGRRISSRSFSLLRLVILLVTFSVFTWIALVSAPSRALP